MGFPNNIFKKIMCCMFQKTFLVVPSFSKRLCAGDIQELGFKVALQSETSNCTHALMIVV